MESGSKFNIPECCHMVLLGVKNQEELLQAANFIVSKDINYAIFFEPDDDMQYTAFCTEPITGDQRKAFRKYKMWSV